MYIQHYLGEIHLVCAHWKVGRLSNAYDEDPPLVRKAHDMFVSYVPVPRTDYIGMNASFSPPSPSRPWSSAFDDAFAGLSRSFSYRGRTLEHSVVGTRRLCQMAQESAPKFCTRIVHCNSPIRNRLCSNAYGQERQRHVCTVRLSDRVFGIHMKPDSPRDRSVRGT